MKLRYFIAGILFSQCLMPVVYSARDLLIDYLKLLSPVIIEVPEDALNETEPKRIIGFTATEEDNTESEEL